MPCPGAQPHHAGHARRIGLTVGQFFGYGARRSTQQRANLRAVAQPRLKAAGITLHWKTQTLSNPLALGPQLQLPVLRIIQECLTNALKHANAQTITLEATNTDTQFMLTIQDDGGGFDVQAAKEQASGKGLNGLEKRARVLGGTLWVESSPQGTRVELQVPLAMAAM
jgi:signal transduction histidine kinase